MNETETKIARYLAERASKKMKATYPMIAEEISWRHPTGRGLGDHLYEVLQHCKNQDLPPLTTILVKKGTRFPPDDAMAYINEVFGDVDLEVAQQEVFDFDWTAVFENSASSPPETNVPFDEKSGIWLTSFWGWSPSDWGCLSFSDEWMRDRFIERTDPGVIVAIYVADNSHADRALRRRLVGFYEVTHEIGHLYDFVSPKRCEEHAGDPERSEKWHFSIRASRAWKIDGSLPFVNDILPGFVSQATGTIVGARGLPVTEPDHIANLQKLQIVEVPIYGGPDSFERGPDTLGRVAKVSKAVYPPKEPYFVAESDGPKHLYVLRLCCDAKDWCEPERSIPDGACIIKVGFSKSPNSRIRQIQAAYPQGRFNWDIVFPNPVPPHPPYPNAKTAIAGEDAMKHFLAEESDRILGGEFFLATEAELKQAWLEGCEKSSNFMKKNDNAADIKVN